MPARRRSLRDRISRLLGVPREQRASGQHRGRKWQITAAQRVQRVLLLAICTVWRLACSATQTRRSSASRPTAGWSRASAGQSARSRIILRVVLVGTTEGSEYRLSLAMGSDWSHASRLPLDRG